MRSIEETIRRADEEKKKGKAAGEAERAQGERLQLAEEEETRTLNNNTW